MLGGIVDTNDTSTYRRTYIKRAGAASFVALTGLAGCSSDGGDGGGSDGDGGSSGNANQNTMTLQANSPAQEGSVHGDVASWIGDIVSEETNGAVNVEAFSGSELGGQAQSIQDISSGALDMYVIPYALTAIVDMQEAQVFDAPYMYDPEEPYKDIYEKTDPQDSEPAKRVINNLAERADIRSLGAVAQGTRRVSLTVPANTEAPQNPEMLSNYTMRAVPISMYAEALKGLGAETTNIDASEIVQSLATGSVDGQENPYNIIKNFQIYKEQTHVIETDHMHVPLAILMHEGVFQDLTDKQQQTFYDAVREVQPRARDQLLSSLESIKQFLRDEGITIVTPEEIDYDAYRSATRARIREQFPDLLDTIESLAHDDYQP
ncbi:MAG: C4-dicarboxylate ABC transporter substrate-binding protein [Halobacteriales archaeon SW_9_67_25]|jgi:TRAP-type C4-dicarboxylate transport system substrate-binding protein|nr:MAG: C4-dicarboxylate ABC transporter substrate-binding protein [Halobacteriales archaeon SW_9_67_25]